MKRTLKQICFYMMSLILLATIGITMGCDKDNDGTSGDVVSGDYVDLGLPSGTKWKSANEVGFYDYNSALETFGTSVPTKEQFEELVTYCTCSRDDTKQGSNFVSTINGNSIFLPAAGGRNCNGEVAYEGVIGSYWSSTRSGEERAWYAFFNSSGVQMGEVFQCSGLSVRLVRDL